MACPCPESRRSAHASLHQRPASANTRAQPAGQEKPFLRGAARALCEEGATLQILPSGSLCHLLLQYFHACALVTHRPDFVALPVTSSRGLLACKHLLLLFVLSQKVLRCEVMRTEGFQAAAPQPRVPTWTGAVGLAPWSCWVMGSGFPALGAGDSSSSRGAALLSEQGLMALPQIQPL